MFKTVCVSFAAIASYINEAKRDEIQSHGDALLELKVILRERYYQPRSICVSLIVARTRNGRTDINVNEKIIVRSVTLR